MRRRKSLSDEKWIQKHFSELVEKYGGRHVVVACSEVFAGDDPAQLMREASRKHPGSVPSGLPVPRPQDFSCAL